jgi:hypothetical protein
MNNLFRFWNQIERVFKDKLFFSLGIVGIIGALVVFFISEIINVNIDNLWNNRIEPILSNIYVIHFSGYIIYGIIIILVSTILFLLHRYFGDISWRKSVKTRQIIKNDNIVNVVTSTDLISYANSALMEINSGIVDGKCLQSYLDILPEAIEKGIITENNARNVVDQLGLKMVKMADGKIIFTKKTSRIRRRAK